MNSRKKKGGNLELVNREGRRGWVFLNIRHSCPENGIKKMSVEVREGSRIEHSKGNCVIRAQNPESQVSVQGEGNPEYSKSLGLREQ